MRLSAQQVYDMLINEDKILELNGQIKFYLGDVSIIVKQRDVVGNIMQEWLQGWLDAKGIEYAPSENTQMPPDFFLNPDDRTKNLLEVKAFNRSAGPGFDIADFSMYEEEIISKPYMLDVDYLIFGYDMNADGVVTIKDVWLKKVWEITRRMEDWSINLQIKNKVVHKIRPAVWYSEGNSADYSVFESLVDFISAIEQAVYQNPKTREQSGDWLPKFLKQYKNETGIDLDIPRWNDIKNKYDLKSIRQKEKALITLEKEENKLDSMLVQLGELQEKLNRLEKSGNVKKIEQAKRDLSVFEERINTANEKVRKAKAEVDKFKN